MPALSSCMACKNNHHYRTLITACWHNHHCDRGNIALASMIAKINNHAAVHYRTGAYLTVGASLLLGFMSMCKHAKLPQVLRQDTKTADGCRTASALR